MVKSNFLEFKIKRIIKNPEYFKSFIENSEGPFLEGENYKTLRGL